MPQLFEDPSHPQSSLAFGPYRVLHQIGSGVLGPVFRSTHPVTRQPVIVKAFKLDLLPEQAARFADALRSQLQALPAHPGLVTVLDTGVSSSTAFVVLAAVAGDTLDVVLRRSGPMRPRAALAVLAPLAAAMDAAHAAGLLHGALHPRDVLIDGATGAPSMTGWGLSAALDAAGVPAPTRRAYAAPERLHGIWEARADIFSLAALGLELLTGRRPGARSEPGMTFAAGVDDGARAALGEVLARGMAERPDDRFNTAAGLSTALRVAAGSEDESDRPSAVASRASVAVPSVGDLGDARSAPWAGAAAASPRAGVPGRPRFAPDAPTVATLAAGRDVAGALRGWVRGPHRVAGVGIVLALVLIAASLVIFPPPVAEDGPASPFLAPPSVAETEVAVADPAVASGQASADGPADGSTPPAGPISLEPDVTPVSRRAPVGKLVIRSEPAGALVTLDGRLIGETPTAVSGLPLGDHSVLVARPGFVPRDQTVRLSSARPSQTVSVALQPGVARAPGRVGAVFVDSRPRGARVSVDGRAMGATPMLVPALAPGTRLVRVELPGFVTRTHRVDIRSGEEARLAVTLERQRLAGLPSR